MKDKSQVVFTMFTIVFAFIILFVCGICLGAMLLIFTSKSQPETTATQQMQN